MRGEYFAWTEGAVAALSELVESGLSWSQVAGRLSAMYGPPSVSPDACRSAYKRSVGRSSPRPRLGSSLPAAFGEPPFEALEVLREERKRGGFSRLYRAPYRATEEQIYAAFRSHWLSYVDFVCETSDVSDDDADAARQADPPRWFERWAVGLSTWSPWDEGEPQGEPK